MAMAGIARAEKPTRTQAGRKRKPPTLSLVQSAITNGTRILANTDHRSGPMRRLKDLIAAHESDLANDLSASEKSLVRRASIIELQLEMMEQRFAQAEGGEATAAQLQAYQQCTNTLRRTLEALGLQRRAKDVSTPVPNLQTYLRQRTHVDEVVEAER
jgi:hypothetical protein